MFPTCNNVQPFPDFMVAKYVHGIPRSVFNRKHVRQDLQRQPICLTVSYHNYILDKILLKNILALKMNNHKSIFLFFH